MQVAWAWPLEPPGSWLAAFKAPVSLPIPYTPAWCAPTSAPQTTPSSSTLLMKKSADKPHWQLAPEAHRVRSYVIEITIQAALEWRHDPADWLTGRSKERKCGGRRLADRRKQRKPPLP
jgi:hypothetical protein